MSRDIHPRNIPNNFEKNPNIGCRVKGLTDGRTDRLTDRPTTRHGNRSSGPNDIWTQTDASISETTARDSTLNFFCSEGLSSGRVLKLPDQVGCMHDEK